MQHTLQIPPGRDLGCIVEASISAEQGISVDLNAYAVDSCLCSHKGSGDRPRFPTMSSARKSHSPQLLLEALGETRVLPQTEVGPAYACYPSLHPHPLPVAEQDCKSLE